jgi:stress response protein YsnF
MATNKNSRLQELGGSDYEIADGQPNIKGWDVKDARGNKIGEVDELIFDTQALKVRYLVIDLEGNTLDLDDRDVLVPIGLAELNDADDDVILPSITAEQLRALPEYDDDNLTPEVENSVRNVFSGTALATGASEDFYKHDHFNEDNLYRRRRQNVSEDLDRETTSDSKTIPVIEENLEVGKRTVETGGVHLRSRITERPVEEKVNLREENVHVEREDVNRPATEADFNRAQQGDIEMREKAEVPVVNKEARVVEEIKISKDVDEREETIRETVRGTDVNIDNIDNTDRVNRTGNTDDDDDQYRDDLKTRGIR